MTFCNKKEIAYKIQDTLLNKKLIAGCQIYNCKSKYWWDNKLEISNEYKLEFRTKQHLFNKIEKEIKDIHNYDTCEITSYELINGSKEIFDWIDKQVKD